MSGMLRAIRRATLALGMIAALLFVGAPTMAGAAVAKPDAAAATDIEFVEATPAVGDLFWYKCLFHDEDTSIIILRFPRSGPAVNNCVLGGEYGFAALISYPSGEHRIKVCNQTVSAPFIEGVNPYAPDGSQTGDIIRYADPPGGGCYSHGVGYPIRKFQAEWHGYKSPWMAPY